LLIKELLGIFFPLDSPSLFLALRGYSAAMKSLSAEQWPLALQMLAELPQPDRCDVEVMDTWRGSIDGPKTKAFFFEYWI
jgi:hypothetical protein